jgi:2'-5' RNA ligase
VSDLEQPQPLPKLRLFVALAVPQSTVEQLLVAQRPLAEAAQLRGMSLRLTPSHQFHMTLAFLGDVPSDQVQPIIDSARNAAAQYHGCTMTPRGFVALPSVRHARVVAVSWDEPTGELASFVASLHTGLRACGCDIEKRAFRAHITVARLRAPHPFAVEQLGPIPGVEPFFAREIAVIQSELRPQGPAYNRLSSATLGER